MRTHSQSMGLKTRSPGRKCANNTIEWGFEFDFDFKFEFQCDFDGGADGGVDRVNAAGVSRRKFLAPAQLTWMTCQLVCSPGRSTPQKPPSSICNSKCSTDLRFIIPMKAETLLPWFLFHFFGFLLSLASFLCVFFSVSFSCGPKD